MTKTFSPSEIQEIIGITPESLRDWRRRGFLGGVGHIVLPNGRITSKTDDALAAGVSRPTWVYALGDVVVLAIARSLGTLTIDLFAQVQLAMQVAPHIVEFANKGKQLPALVDNQFAAAWRGLDRDADFQVVRFNDLNRIITYGVAHAILIDMKKEADNLPELLVRYLDRIGGAK